MVTLTAITHHDFSLSERERLEDLLRLGAHRFYVGLVTCNRRELYAGDGAVPARVVRHLFRVVSGLDSALVGETAIQAQVKDAFRKAVAAGTASAALNRLFQAALRTGKRVRSETGISKGAVSHGLAVVKIMEREKVDPARVAVTAVGAGRLIRSVVRHLVKRGAGNLAVVNRTRENAERLARETGCRTLGFDELGSRLAATDVLVSATASPHRIITPDMFPPARPMLVFDLGFPRDVDESAGGLPGVRLLNLSDVESLMNAGLRLRREELGKASAIIREETLRFLAREREIARRRNIRPALAVTT